AEKHKLSELKPSEVFITNDPYRGAQHLPDIFVFSPIFSGDRLIAFGASAAHHLDVGGAAAASLNPSATEIYAEGFLIPAIKTELPDAFNSGLFPELFAANVRVPKLTIGDLNAQLAANHTCRTRLLALVDKYGLDVVLDCMQALIDYCERRTREEIAKIPDGTYPAVEMMDNSVFSKEPIEIHTKVTVRGSNVFIDFAGTSPQVAGPINAPFTATVSAVYTAVHAILTGEEIPANAGCYRPIKVNVPYGSLLNPSPPTAVRARVNTCLRVMDSIFRAFATVLPERVTASGFHASTLIAMSNNSGNEVEVFTDPVNSGFGGSSRNDGESQCGNPISNCKNTPVEAIETDYNFLRIKSYALVPDTAGAGKHRGSMGVRRDFEIFEDNVKWHTFSDRHQHRPWGLFGGQDGTLGRIVVTRDGDEIVLGPVSSFELRRGDVVSVINGGGGGYGDPHERDRALVLKDLAEERISAEKAAEIYGLTGSEGLEIQNKEERRERK
ncbi:MAG: hydantoinase B/oxoprolinase family protein, partial [Acidiferrobacterales bacterium]